MIYFIFSPDDPRSLVKIGYTKGDVDKRLAALQVGIPFRLRLIIAITGDKSVERGIHSRFHRSRCHGEWFHPTEEIRLFIREFLGDLLPLAMASILADPEQVAWQARALGWSEDAVRNELRIFQAS